MNTKKENVPKKIDVFRQAKSCKSWTKTQKTALTKAIKRKDVIAYYCSGPDGEPANGGSGTVCTPGAVHEAPAAVLCEKGLHATVDAPHVWRGARVWIVACSGDVQRDENKLVCRRREVIGEVLVTDVVDPRVALRLNAPPTMLARAAKDPDVNVRWAAAHNPNTPPDALAELAKDPEGYARHAAAYNLKKRGLL